MENRHFLNSFFFFIIFLVKTKGKKKKKKRDGPRITHNFVIKLRLSTQEIFCMSQLQVNGLLWIFQNQKLHGSMFGNNQIKLRKTKRKERNKRKENLKEKKKKEPKIKN